MGSHPFVDRREDRAEGRLHSLLSAASPGPILNGRLAGRAGRQGGSDHLCALVAKKGPVERGVGLLPHVSVGIAARPLLAADAVDGLVESEGTVEVDHDAIRLHRLRQAFEEFRIDQHPGLAEDRLQYLGLEAAAELGKHRHCARQADQSHQIVDNAQRLDPRRVVFVVLHPELPAGCAKSPIRFPVSEALHSLMEAEEPVIRQRARVG